ARDAVLQQRELQFQRAIYLSFTERISDHASGDPGGPDPSTNPGARRRRQPVFHRHRPAPLGCFHDRRRALRGRRMENPPEHFPELWFALRNSNRHSVRGELGAAREPGVGTRPLQGRAEDGAARRIRNLLRPLFLQLSAGSGAVQRSHAETVCCHATRSEEHTSELQSLTNLVCRLLLAKTAPRGAPFLPLRRQPASAISHTRTTTR